MVLGDINVITQAELKIILYIFVYVIYISTEDMDLDYVILFFEI